MPSKNCFCQHGLPGLSGKDLGWPVKPQSIFHAKPPEGLGLGKALKSTRLTEYGGQELLGQYPRAENSPVIPLKSKWCGQALFMQDMAIVCDPLPVLGSPHCYLPVSLGFSQSICSSYHCYTSAGNGCPLCHYNMHVTNIPNNISLENPEFLFWGYRNFWRHWLSHRAYASTSVKITCVALLLQATSSSIR